MESTSHAANLDCLRAFAVLAVAADHGYAWHLTLHPETHGLPMVGNVGHAGVLAFFVHTSLVLMWSLQRINPEGRALAFYVRRAFRIYPLSVLIVIAALLLKIPAAPELGVHFHAFPPIAVAANLLLVQNVIGRVQLLNPLWSLPYEVDMYVVLPFLFLLALKPKSGRVIFILWLAFVAAGTGVFILTGHANMFAYIPCFLGGIFAFAVRSARRAVLPAPIWPLALLAWFLGISYLVRSPSLDILVQGSFCLALGAAIPLFQESRARAFNAITAAIAKYSYGVYLCHLPVLWALHRVWTPQHEFLGYFLWACGTALTSFLLFHLAEDPMIRLGKRLAASLRPLRTTVPAEV